MTVSINDENRAQLGRAIEELIQLLVEDLYKKHIIHDHERDHIKKHSSSKDRADALLKLLDTKQNIKKNAFEELYESCKKYELWTAADILNPYLTPHKPVDEHYSDDELFSEAPTYDGGRDSTEVYVLNTETIENYRRMVQYMIDNNKSPAIEDYYPTAHKENSNDTVIITIHLHFYPSNLPFGDAVESEPEMDDDCGDEDTLKQTLVSLLGLKPDVEDWLNEMDPECRSHQEDIYNITRFIEHKEAMLLNTNQLLSSENAECLAKALVQLGFEEITATKIAQNVHLSLIPLQFPSFWARQFLEHTINHHPKIRNLPVFPYQSDHFNQWFEHNPRHTSTQGASSDVPVKMINLSSKKGDKKRGDLLVKDHLSKAAEDADAELYYHGTDSLSAQNILEDGILLRRGRPNQDFSDGNAFYVSTDYEIAKRWAGSRSPDGNAVIVFKISNQMLGKDFEGLDFTSESAHQGKIWEKIVKGCRSGRLKGLDEYLEQSFIKGPICKNPTKLDKEGAKGFGDNFSIQLCIRDKALADRFSDLANIYAVIFL